MTEQSSQIWRKYYERAIAWPHSKRTEFALRLNQSRTRVAIDCGCGAGGDMEYLATQGYQVHGFDINADSVAICQERFSHQPLVDISESSFETFDYPTAGVVIANTSLFFAEPERFSDTWLKISSCIDIGGVFAGDFMGVNDSWANNYHLPTTPLTASQVRELFTNFEIIRFIERDEAGQTSLGKHKHWHTFSVVAIKRA